MKKKVICNILTVGVSWLAGFIIIEVNRELDWLGILIFVSGTGYAGFNLIAAAIAGFKASDLYNSKRKELAKKRAEQEVFRYKSLMDSGVLTQDEFDRKAKELKTVILQD